MLRMAATLIPIPTLALPLKGRESDYS